MLKSSPMQNMHLTNEEKAFHLSQYQQLPGSAAITPNDISEGTVGDISNALIEHVQSIDDELQTLYLVASNLPSVKSGRAQATLTATSTFHTHHRLTATGSNDSDSPSTESSTSCYCSGTTYDMKLDPIDQ